VDVTGSATTITTAVNGGDVTLIGDTMNFATTSVISANSSSTIALRQQTSGVAINLGSAVDTTPSTLELSDAELDRITAGTLQIVTATVVPSPSARRSPGRRPRSST
jgi:hypothetical protein